MARSKYINTFDTTAEYNNYIESALPEFPNVAYDKEAGEVKITRTSPNDHVVYGTLSEPSSPLEFKINYKSVYAHIDSLNNTFYIDQSDLTSLNISTITAMDSFIYYADNKITSLKKISLDTSNVTNISGIFYNKSVLTSLNLSGIDFSNVSNINSTNFYNCTGLTDVYITVEGTLMKLTNNLSSQGGSYIPSNNGNCTIHYNDIDYKWQNNAWTPQN